MAAVRAATLLIGSGGCSPQTARTLDVTRRRTGGVARVTTPGPARMVGRQDPDAFNRVVPGSAAGRG
jgi:hypothetical protein